VFGALLGLAIVIGGGRALAYEEPAYEVVRSFDDFELRHYAPYLVAETEVRGAFDEVGGEAFRRLYGFISGGNTRSAEVALTAPVTQHPVASAEGEAWLFRFVMPRSYTRESLPDPLDPRVRIRGVDAQLIAARRFSGTWRGTRWEENGAALRGALERAGLAPVGATTFARFDAPFVPWFLRRNEVLIGVREPGFDALNPRERRLTAESRTPNEGSKTCAE
jgi:hypothetical protein